MALSSAVYVGSVYHGRKAPRHAFSYNVYMLFLDLQELTRLSLPPLFSTISWLPAIFWFRRSDFLGDSSVPIDEAVRNCVEKQTGKRPTGRICLLTHIRTWFFLFNPVSFYYCYDEDDKLQCIVAEVSNTPWLERHAYVLQPGKAANKDEPNDQCTFVCEPFEKIFHVSPFFSLDYTEDWRFSVPGQDLHVVMKNISKSDGTKHFDAVLKLKRKEFSTFNLVSCLVCYPLMTLKVVAGIYIHALRLFRKGATFYPNPRGTETIFSRAVAWISSWM
eukprot:tig00000615_g2591.t1